MQYRGNRLGNTIITIFLSVLVFISSILALAGCKPIEDLNGPDNKTLATLGDLDLTKISGSISTGNSRKSGRQSVLRDDDDYAADYDFDNIELDFSRLNGTTRAMVTFLEKGEKLTIEFSSEISAGNFAAVFLSPDNDILEKIEADRDATIRVTADIRGDYLLNLAGESASGSIRIVREYK